MNFKPILVVYLFFTPFEIIQYAVQQSDNKGLVGSASARNGTCIHCCCCIARNLNLMHRFLPIIILFQKLKNNFVYYMIGLF